MWSKCQAPVLWAGLSNIAGGRCLLSGSLIKSNSSVSSTDPPSWERTEKGQEVGWNEIRTGKNCAVNAATSGIDLTNWNGIEGEAPDGSPLAWGGVLAGSDRIPSETYLSLGSMLMPPFIPQPLSHSYLHPTHSLGCGNRMFMKHFSHWVSWIAYLQKSLK